MSEPNRIASNMYPTLTLIMDKTLDPLISVFKQNVEEDAENVCYYDYRMQGDWKNKEEDAKHIFVQSQLFNTLNNNITGLPKEDKRMILEDKKSIRMQMYTDSIPEEATIHSCVNQNLTFNIELDENLDNRNASSSSSTLSMYSTCSEKIRPQIMGNYQFTEFDTRSCGCKFFESETNDKYNNKGDIVSKSPNSSKSCHSELSSTSSDVEILTGKYSFDSLLETVMKSNRHKFTPIKSKTFKSETNNNECRLVCNCTQTCTCEENSKMKWHKKRYRTTQSICNRDSSMSSLSTCSVATFKIAKSQSKMEIGINEVTISETVHKKKRQLNKMKYVAAMKNDEKSKWKNGRRTFLTESDGSYQTVSSSFDSGPLQYSVETRKMADHGSDTHNSSKSKKNLLKLKEPNPQIKQLEMYLNLVTQSQRHLHMNESIDEHDNAETDSDLEGNSSAFESCEDVSNPDYMDAEMSFENSLYMTTPSYMILKDQTVNDDSLKSLSSDGDNDNLSTTEGNYYGQNLSMNIWLDSTNNKADGDYIKHHDTHHNRNVHTVRYNFNNVKFHEENDYTVFKFYPTNDSVIDYLCKENRPINNADLDTEELCYNNEYHENRHLYNRDIICANLSVMNSKEKADKNNANDTWDSSHATEEYESSLVNTVLPKKITEKIDKSPSNNTINLNQYNSFVDAKASNDFSIHSTHEVPSCTGVELSSETNRKPSVADINKPDKLTNEPTEKIRPRPSIKKRMDRSFPFRTTKSYDARYKLGNNKKIEGNLINDTTTNLRSQNGGDVNSDKNAQCTSTKKFYSKGQSPLQDLVENMDYFNASYNENDDRCSEDTTVASNTHTDCSSSNDIDFQTEKFLDDLCSNGGLCVNDPSHTSLKGILKKKSSSSINDSSSMLDVMNEPDRYDSLQRLDSLQKVQKKSVKFSMPHDSAVNKKPMNFVAHNRAIANTIRPSYLPTLRSNKNEKELSKTTLPQQWRALRNQPEEVRNVIEPLHCAECQLYPTTSKQVQNYPGAYHVLLKNSQFKNLLQTQHLECRSNAPESSQYVVFSAKNRFTSFMYLRPNRVFKNEDDFMKAKIGEGYEEVRGYIRKHEICNTVVYCKPLCARAHLCIEIMNVKNMLNKMTFNDFAKELGGMNPAAENSQIGVNAATKRNGLRQNVRGKQTMTQSKTKRNAESKKNKFENKENQFFNYVQDVQNIVRKTETGSNGSNDSYVVNSTTQVIQKLIPTEANHEDTYIVSTSSSQVIFDVSANSDAVLSLTAYENNEKSKNIEKLTNVPPKKSKLKENEKLSNKEHKYKAKPATSNLLIKQDSLTEQSTVNITIGNLLKEKPVNRKRVNVIGAIISKEEQVYDKPNIDDLIEEVPVRDQTQSNDEASSIDNYTEEYMQYVKESELKMKRMKLYPKAHLNEMCVESDRNRLPKCKKALFKHNYTSPDPFSFDKKYNAKPPFTPYVSRNYQIDLNSDPYQRRFETTHLLPLGVQPQRKRPQSCIETTRRPMIYDNNTGTIQSEYDPELDADIQKCKYSKSSDAINAQDEAELSDIISNLKNKTAVNNTKGSKKINSGNKQLQKPCLKPIIKRNTKDDKKNTDCLENVESNTNTTNSTTDISDRKLNKNMDKPQSEEQNYEFLGINDSQVICPIRECVSKESQSELSFSSSPMKLKEELASITSMKAKIRETFPDGATVANKLLKRVSKLSSNPHIKPCYPSSDPETVDCYGAPLKDKLDLDFYNSYGKPVVNIHGCKIYDKFGIPKMGAYGKPIHNILRNKLKSVLAQIKLPKVLPVKNSEFEEDLLKVLNTFHGLKTDLYGRVYDFYGRPLFDCFGYLQYDVNGNPLTDAFNRALRDLEGRPLITASVTNSTRFVTQTRLHEKESGRTSNTSASADKNTNNNDTSTKVTTTTVDKNYFNNPPPPAAPVKIKSILSNSANRLLDNSVNPDSPSCGSVNKPIKKQVSFDECTIVYLENKVVQEPRKANSLTNNGKLATTE